jgi:hypothetical protein
VAVGVGGEVYVAWFSYTPHGIYFDYSTDRGQTFGPDQLVVPVDAYSGNINGEITVFPYPGLATDVSLHSQYYGNLYMVYMDFAVADMDIYFIRSENGGQSWTSAVRVNDDPINNGCDQFHPWLSVDEFGVIHMIFYDRRLDVNNMLFDLFYTYSNDAGVTWAPNERITNISSDPGQAEAGLIGEYIGLHASHNAVQMVWTDTRNGHQDVYAGRKLLTGINDKDDNVPQNIRLAAPYPNPFNADVSIDFYSTGERNVRVDIVDLMGRRVATIFDGISRAGANKLTWNSKTESGKEVSSGVYFVRLSDTGIIDSKKIVLLR